jgi:hypothetical protein
MHSAQQVSSLLVSLGSHTHFIIACVILLSPADFRDQTVATGVPAWPRLFHSMRASRQTELQREFPIHVVRSWLRNSPHVAQQSYLLVTEDDFAKAAGAKEGDGG